MLAGRPADWDLPLAVAPAPPSPVDGTSKRKCPSSRPLRASAGSPRLALMVAGTVGQALVMMAGKAEYMAGSGPDLRAVATPCNAAQLRNIALCNCLQEVHRSAAGMLGRLPPAAAEALAGPLAELQAAAVAAVAPIFRALVEGMEEALVHMHSTPAYAGGTGSSAAGAGAAGAALVDTSPYMHDLARQLTHCRLEFLSKFNPSPVSPVPSGAWEVAVMHCTARTIVSCGAGVLCGHPFNKGCVCEYLTCGAAPSLHPLCLHTAVAAVARSLVERMAARLLLFAVRHASLLRPLPQNGKLQLAKVSGEVAA